MPQHNSTWLEETQGRQRKVPKIKVRKTNPENSLHNKLDKAVRYKNHADNGDHQEIYQIVGSFIRVSKLASEIQERVS